MKKIKVQSRRFFQDAHIFNIFKEKYIFKLTRNSFEICNSIHFNNDFFNIFIYF